MTEIPIRLSRTELALMCARASNLSERISGQYVPAGGDLALAARRLERWQRLSEQGVQRQLAALLGASARVPVSERHVLDLLGPMRLADGAPMPAWAELVNEIVEHVARSFALTSEGRSPDHKSLPNKFGIPFEHLYWPVADFAWDRVISQLPGAAAQIGVHARQSLQKQLLQRLSGFASPLLHTTFLAHLAVARSGMFRHLFDVTPQMPGQEEDNRQYASFIVEQGRDGLRSFFMRSPVVARLVATATGLWIEATHEFLGRLHKDRRFLASEFNGGARLGILCGVQGGVSDPHRGGRSVLILQFAGGTRIVYKPRSMRIDRVFYELIRKLNEVAPRLDLGVLLVSNRRDYGWMEFTSHAPCLDIWAARRYYRRAGSLACLAHWLQGIDFHRENVVAAGEHPMLVDLECLAHPLRPDEIDQATNAPASALGYSVLRTGLLPMWQKRTVGGAQYDNCGLNGPVSRRSLLMARHWERINTDAMDWVYKTWCHRQRGHRPVLRGRTLSMHSFERGVLAGYRETAAVLQNAGGSGISSLRREIYGAAARRIKRPTLIYGLLLRQSLEPVALNEGIDRSIELMGLSCAAYDPDWKEEIESLEMLDVPHFQFARGSKNVPTNEQLNHPSVSLAHQEDVVRASLRRQVKLEAGRFRLVTKRRGSSLRV